MKKHIYRTCDVQQVQLKELLPALVGGCIVALDVAKEKLVAAVATVTGEVLKLIRFDHPTQTRQFLQLLEALELGVGKNNLRVALEPTGTYGDAVRYQVALRDIPVLMVSPKRTHDSRALFDNVSSLHDPKSAAQVAKLCSLELATAWKAEDATRTRLRALVELRRHEGERYDTCLQRLESRLARHWPEFGQWLNTHAQVSALHLLAEFGSPARVRREPEEARELLRRASHGRLSAEVIDGLIEDTKETLGVPTSVEEHQYITVLAKEALESRRQREAIEKQMEAMCTDAAFRSLSAWMGTYTAAVLFSLCDPRQYSSAKELVKACGLNLREKSSGEHHGKLSITKRGPGLVRQVMYLFALRMIAESPTVNAWYARRRGYTETSRVSAVVAVMRKLVMASFHVARGAVFQPGRLFDERRLELPVTSAQRRTPPEPRRQRRTKKRRGVTAAASA